MRKTVAALTAGALITGGALVATAQTDDADTTDPKPPVVEMERGERMQGEAVHCFSQRSWLGKNVRYVGIHDLYTRDVL